MIQMLKSMTGYGRGEVMTDGRHIVFEIKSVNHKFFEFNARIPRSCMFAEDKLKTLVQSRVSRGKVDVFLQVEMIEDTGSEVLINLPLAEAYVRALRELKERYILPDDVSLSLLARYPDLLTVQKAPENEEAVWTAICAAAEPALSSFLEMRETEGARLHRDIAEKTDRLETLVGEVEKLTPETVNEYRERLQEKLTELLGTNRFDEQRVLTEVALLADKVAVDEETVRLRSHIRQLRQMVDSEEPVGRKIDFLVQEMNRETNTIGSKSQNSKIAYLVVDMKSEIEKIREQIQNVE